MDITEVTAAVEALGSAFEAFKVANDQRLAEIAKGGSADALLTEKVERLSAELDRLSAVKQRLEQIETAVSRSLKAGEPEAVGSGARAEHKAAFLKWFRRGGEGALAELEAKALSVGSDPDGGYLVPAEMAERIVTTVFETSALRALAAVMTITGDSVEMLVDKDEAGAIWVGETESPGDTATPQFAKLRIPVHTLAAEPRATQQLLDDAHFDIEGWLAAKVADKFARTENAAFLTGNGVGKPRGLLTHPAVAEAGWSWGSIGYVASGAAGDWAASNPADVLISTVHALKTAYRQGAAWLMDRARLAEVRKFKDTASGGYLWQPGLQAGQPATLLGYPVAEAEDMPEKAAGSLSVAFGNFRQAYQIVDRLGIRVQRDPFTAKPWVKFYTTRRSGGDVVNFEAFKVIKFAAS